MHSSVLHPLAIDVGRMPGSSLGLPAQTVGATPAGERRPLAVGILGAGRMGCALAIRLVRDSRQMRLTLLADGDPDAAGLRHARRLGVSTSGAGVGAMLERPQIEIVFDASSPQAHIENVRLLHEMGNVRIIDLTAAAAGSPTAPLASLGAGEGCSEFSLLSCSAQATLPAVRAAVDTTPLLYAECVSVIARSALGPVARDCLDEMVAATERGLLELGGAANAKAIIAVSPAEPPVRMRNTVHLVPEAEFEHVRISEAVATAVASTQKLLPGYRLRGEPAVRSCQTPWGQRAVLTFTIEVAGQRDAHLGSIELMSACAQRLGEQVAHGLRKARSE